MLSEKELLSKILSWAAHEIGPRPDDEVIGGEITALLVWFDLLHFYKGKPVKTTSNFKVADTVAVNLPLSNDLTTYCFALLLFRCYLMFNRIKTKINKMTQIMFTTLYLFDKFTHFNHK